MRIERTGKVEPLTPRFEKFLIEALSGRSLDDIQCQQTTRADYICLNGLLAIEIKSLEEDGSERLDNLTNELSQRDDWPVFLGSAPMESFIKNMSDPDGIRRRVLDRIGRAILNHLKKANAQLKAHALAFPRKNLLRMMLLINEDHTIYDPHTVSYILWHALRRQENGRSLYEHVDTIFFVTERHAAQIGDRIALPLTEIEGASMAKATWKHIISQHFVNEWARWNGNPLHGAYDHIMPLETIDHIPDLAPRHERWQLDYRRNPYMRPLTKEQLHDRFDDINLIGLLSLRTDSPVEVSFQDKTNNMKALTHIMIEMADRAIPAPVFRLTHDRLLMAAHRQNMPPQVFIWLEKIKQERHQG